MFEGLQVLWNVFSSDPINGILLILALGFAGVFFVLLKLGWWTFVVLFGGFFALGLVDKVFRSRTD